MTSSEVRTRGVVAGLSLLSGIVIFWLALRSAGSDWFISETHADIIYTGLRRFREYPFFSFVFNGGAYLLQDPQSNLYSPVVPLVLLVGPSVGLRLMEGLWAALGVYLFVLWMRRRVSVEAALIAGVASVTGLGVLWRVAVGNDMFLWHLGLPGLLWAVDRVMLEKSIKSALAFGLILGVLLLGPTFHSFTYLFLPAVPLYVLIQLGFERPRLLPLAKITGLFLAACSLALLIASPKLVCWTKFEMARPIPDHGVISVGSALRGLFDYSWAKHELVAAKNGDVLGGHGWGLEECAAALSPVGSILALMGPVFAFRSRPQRSVATFALVLIVFGLALTCSWPAWSAFRALTGGNFRVAPRFLGLAAFGLATLVAFGADGLFQRWRRIAIPATLGLGALMIASVIGWTLSAARYSGASAVDTVHPNAMNPFAVAADERAAADLIDTFKDLTKPGFTERPVLEGIGYRSGFLVVGNKFHRRLWRPRVAAPTVPLLMSGVHPEQATVSHLSIVLHDVAPHSRVRLRAQMPSFGVVTKTTPRRADVEVRKDRTFLLIENHGDRPVKRVTVRAELPISQNWFYVAIFSALAAILALMVDWPPFSIPRITTASR